MSRDSFDACMIGPVARDINAVGLRAQPPQPGGAAYYSTMVYAALGLRAAVVTRVSAADEVALLAELSARRGVTIFNLGTAVSTTFRNLYDPADPMRAASASMPSRRRSAPATCRRFRRASGRSAR